MNGASIRSLWPECRHGRWMSDAYEPELVSVIVPTHDRAYILAEALESVWQQAYRPIELIVVDDGSTDSTSELVEQWGRKRASDAEFRCRYFRQTNGGAPSARNRGLAECAGEFIQFHDSDDLLHPQKLERQVGLLAGDEAVDFVYSPIGSFTKTADWSAPAYSGLRPPDGLLLLNFLRGGMWNTISGVYRRRACRAIGPWDERAVIVQDWDYNVRFLLGDPCVGYAEEMLSLHRWTGDRVTETRRSERSLRSMYVLETVWTEWIEAAGRLDQETERVLADLLYSVARQALLQGYVELSREVLESIRGFGVEPTLSRRFAQYTLLARLPARLGPFVARTLWCVARIRQWALETSSSSGASSQRKPS